MERDKGRGSRGKERELTMIEPVLEAHAGLAATGSLREGASSCRSWWSSVDTVSVDTMQARSQNRLEGGERKEKIKSE